MRRLVTLGLLITWLCKIHGCHAEPSSTNTDSRICAAPPYNPFYVTIAHPEPVCLPSESPPSHLSDEFLSFEEWKSVKLSESAIHTPERATNPNSNETVPNSSHEAIAAAILTPAGPTILASEAPVRVPQTDRFNYASQDCSARIQNSHKSFRSPYSILSPKRDKYMLSPCSTKEKFVVIELCDDIQIDTVQLANFEFFSGIFKDINISAAHTYNSESWNPIGSFRAKNIRAVQSFQIPRDPRFFRYIRIDFISHYGSEYYCPVSLLRVYGLTQIEEYKWGEWEAAWSHEREAVASLPQSVLPFTALDSEGTKEYKADTPFIPRIPMIATETLAVPIAPDSQSPSASSNTNKVAADTHTSVINNDAAPPVQIDVEAITDSFMGVKLVTDSVSPTAAYPTPTPLPTNRVGTPSPESSQNSVSPTVASIPVVTETSSTAQQDPSSVLRGTARFSSTSIRDLPSTIIASARGHYAYTESGTNFTEPIATLSNTSTSIEHYATSSSIAPTPSRPVVITVSTQTRQAVPSTNAGSQGGSESIYRTIMNRLNVIESNSSLGVRYVEDQTRYMREALRRLEHDVGRLETLSTHQQVMAKRTMFEFQQNKRELELERKVLLTQLNALADEVSLERKLGLAQLGLLSMVLVFIAFTRSASMETSFMGGISASSSMVTSAKQRAGQWRSARTNSHPERPKLPAELFSPRPIGEMARTGSVSVMNPQTPAHLPGPGTPRSVEILSPSNNLRSPFDPTDKPTPLKHVLRAPHPLEESLQRPEALPQPSSLGRRDTGTPHDASNSVRRTLAKTAHLHEVRRRRRVSSHSSGKNLLAVQSPSRSPHFSTSASLAASTSKDASRDVFGVFALPLSPRSAQTMRGSSKTAKESYTSVPVDPEANWDERVALGTDAGLKNVLKSPSKTRIERSVAGNVAEVMGDDTTGSDIWEDTSDTGDDGDSTYVGSRATRAHRIREYSGSRSRSQSKSKSRSRSFRRRADDENTSPVPVSPYGHTLAVDSASPRPISRPSPLKPSTSTPGASPGIYTPESHRQLVSPVGLNS